MNSKKRKKKLTKKQRSVAAKKGWKKRKAKSSIEAALRNELELERKKTRRLRAKLDEKKIRSVVAKQSVEEQLAHIKPTDHEAIIKMRLQIAENDGRFDDEVNELYDEYGYEYTPSEIYTMGKSP